MKLFSTFFQRLKPIYARIEKLLNQLRVRIPGLPGNRAILSAVGLIFVALILFGAFQILLAPKQKFTTFTMPYEQNFDDVNLRQWFIGDGVWSIRDAALAQTVGGDTAAQAFVPFKLVEDTPYHTSVFITLKKDSRAAGISFNAQYPNLSAKQHRIYLSRPDKTTLELVSGYMDETGSFVTQILVPLSVNTTEFRIDLYVYENTYLVQVNGQRMIENRPLFYKNGLVGFYTIGPAVFDTFKLTATDTPNPGNMVYSSDFDQDPGGAGWVPFNGTWKIDSKQMVQSDPNLTTAGIGYETSTFQNFTLRATFHQIERQGAGILFNMPSPYQINGAHVVRYSDEADSIIWGYVDDKGAFNRQGFSNVPPAGTGDHTFQIFSGDASYDIFLDGQVLVRDIPLQSKNGNIGLITAASSAGYSMVEVYPLFGISGQPTTQLTPLVSASTTPTLLPSKKTTITTTTTPTTSVRAALSSTPQAPISTQIATPQPIQGGHVVYQGVFSGKLSDQNWTALSGNWSFQDNNFVQQKVDGYDFAAVYTKTNFTNYSYQVGLTQTQGSGAGLLFNIPNTNKLSGASMVRYSDRRNNALMWGYFDDNGVYKNQGYADVNPAGQDHHILRVDSHTSSFSIYLDGRLVIQNEPLKSGQNSGYIGLLSSVSSVSFDEVTVDSIGSTVKANFSSLDGFTDQRSISGKWELSKNTITQNVPDLADYVWNTGILATQYTVSAKITLPKNSTTLGGGFIIHMAERGSKKNAYIVRITNGGKGVWWGATDETGKFKGQGSNTFKAPVTTFTFKIIVSQGKMAVFVNDGQIVADLPIPEGDGWIGLVAYGGPVKFENVKLEVTQ